MRSIDSDVSDSETYAESTPLTWVFGDQPKVRIIAALISEYGNSVTADEISILAGVDLEIVKAEMSPLLEHDIIVSEQEEESTKYKINTSSESVDYMRKLEGSLLKKWYEAQKDE
jgi:transcription initiation factor IIE alpha subunit